MRSPPPCIAPKVHDVSRNETQSLDEGSVCSFNSTSSLNQQRPGLSFAPPAWGNPKNHRTQTIRVVARIRPPYDNSERFVFALKADENLSRLHTPVKESVPSGHSVSDLVSIFNSPDAKPIGPSFLSPSAETPLHVNRRVSDVAPKSSTRKSIQPPTPSRELADSAREVVANICASIPQVVLAGEKSFNFDAVFDTSASQDDVFSSTVGDAIRRNIFQGFNTTIMTYGQRYSGKTYTMYGSKQDIDPNIPDDASIRTEEAYGSHENDGIVPRAIQDLFRAKDTQMTGSDVILNLSFIEINNDSVIDLLTCKRGSNPSLSIRDSSDKTGVPVKGLTHIRIKSTSHARHILEAALRRRISSRSHTICTINVVINPALKQSVLFGKNSDVTTTDVITAKLTLVDLAGSERSRFYDSIEEQRENVRISKDLLVLSKCISALTEVKPGAKVHVPFRDCKLTRLLSDSLGGNCFTVMVACLSPSHKDSEETLSVLKIAEQAKNITNTIRMNRLKMTGLTPAEGAALRRENKVLKSHMLEMTKKMQLLRRGNSNSEFINDPEVVIDFGSLQFCSPRSFKPVGKLIEEQKWQLKFEKLLNHCKEANFNVNLEDIALDSKDESLLEWHAREIQDLKEQINQFMRFDDDCISTNSGLTADYDDRSVVSNLTMLSLSQQSLRTCDSIEKLKAKEVHDEQVLGQCVLSSCDTNEATVDAENKLSNIMEEIEVLTRDKVQLENCLSANNEKKSALESSLEKLKYEVKKLTEEKIQLCQEVEDLQNTAGLISDLSNERAAKLSLEKELASKTEELLAMKSEMRSPNEISDVIRAPDDEKDEELKHLRQKVASYETILMADGDKLSRDINMSSIDEREANAEIDSDAKDLMKPFDSDEDYVVQLKDKIISLESELETLKKLHIKPPLLPTGIKRKAIASNYPNASPKRISSNNSVISVSKLLSDYDHNEDDSLSFNFHKKNIKETSLSAREKSALEAFNASFDQNNTLCASFDDCSVQEDGSFSSDHRAIRLHAQKLLYFADKAISQNFADSFSIDSDADKENASFNVSVEGHINTSLNSSFNFSGKVAASSSKFTVGCVCPTSIFSGNADHIEFFLPRLGKACKCGAEEKAKSRFQDPTSLQAFLRSWQVSFLSEVGIFTAKQLIQRQRGEPKKLAKALQKYRNAMKMKPVRCKSALVALHIWSRTAQTILKSNKENIIRQESNMTNKMISKDSSIEKPSLLEFDVNHNDDVSVMSIEPLLYEGEYEV